MLNSCVKKAAQLGAFDLSLKASSVALDACGLIDERLTLAILVHHQNVTFAQWARRMMLGAAAQVTSPNHTKAAGAYAALSINHGKVLQFIFCVSTQKCIMKIDAKLTKIED